MKRKTSPKSPEAVDDPLAEIQRKLDALTERVDRELSSRPAPLIAQSLATKPALLGPDPKAKLLDTWRSMRTQFEGGAAIVRARLARVLVTPWAGAALLAGVLALLQGSIAFLVIAIALSAAAVSTTGPAPPPEQSPPVAS